MLKEHSNIRFHYHSDTIIHTIARFSWLQMLAFNFTVCYGLAPVNDHSPQLFSVNLSSFTDTRHSFSPVGHATWSADYPYGAMPISLYPDLRPLVENSNSMEEPYPISNISRKTNHTAGFCSYSWLSLLRVNASTTDSRTIQIIKL